MLEAGYPRSLMYGGRREAMNYPHDMTDDDWKEVAWLEEHVAHAEETNERNLNPQLSDDRSGCDPNNT